MSEEPKTEAVETKEPEPETTTPLDDVPYEEYHERREKGETAVGPEEPEGDAKEEKEAPVVEAEPEAEETAEAESGKEEEKEEDAGAEKEKDKPKKSGLTKRINKLTERTYRLEGENAALKEQIAGKKLEEIKTEAGAPVLEAFETQEEYEEALIDFKVERRFEKQRESEIQAQQEAEIKELHGKFFKGLEKVRQENEDYEDLSESVANEAIHKSVELAIIELDNGPEVLYYLMKNPEVREKLRGLSPLRAVAELGPISLSLKDASKGSDKTSEKPGTAPTKKRASALPEPRKPVRGGAANANTKLEDMSQEEYVKAREAGRQS